ncbi:MAG: ribosome maturation factor RimM [Candidatus Kapabacteria bacterium]|nr:ribosome maturation factor RimM [Candidatus Kapabacteria bacterium]
MSSYSEYIGVIARTHGLDGTVVLMDTIGITNGLVPGATLGIGYSRDFTKTYTIDMFESSPKRTTLRLRELQSADSAQALVEQAVYARAQDVGLNEDERHRIGDIEGCTVVTADGGIVGIVTDVWLMPANDVWVVTLPDGRTVPFPVIDDVVVSVETGSRRIVVNVLPGLLDLGTTTAEDHDE